MCRIAWNPSLGGRDWQMEFCIRILISSGEMMAGIPFNMRCSFRWHKWVKAGITAEAPIGGAAAGYPRATAHRLRLTDGTKSLPAHLTVFGPRPHAPRE